MTRRVVFFIGFPAPFPGAGWVRVGDLADRLSALGFRVTVLTTISPSTLDKLRMKEARGVHFRRIPLGFTGRWPTLSEFVGMYLCLLCSLLQLASLHPELLFVSVPPGGPGVGVLVAARILRLPAALDYRDEWEDSLRRLSPKTPERLIDYLTHLAAETYRDTRLSFAVTPSLSRILTRVTGRKAVFLPNGADLSLFKPPSSEEKIREKLALGIPESTKVISYVGHLGWCYEVERIVEAMALLGNEGSHVIFLFAGEGARLSGVLEAARDLGLQARVRYLGLIHNRLQIARLLRSTDVFVVPYADDPLMQRAYPSKLFEAAACGVPVVVTAHQDSDVAKLVRGSGLGVVVPPANLPQLASAITTILTNGSEASMMGTRGRQLVEKSFDRSAIFRIFLSEIKAFLDGGNP